MTNANAPRTMVLLTVQEIDKLADAIERPPRPSWWAPRPYVSDSERMRARGLRDLANAIRMAEDAKAQRMSSTRD